MAYQLRLYAPTGAGITSLTVRNSEGTLLGRVAPKGTGTACFNQSGLTTGVTITPSLEDGVTVSLWVVNVDGTAYYQYTDTCTIGYDSTVSNIQIRLEVAGTPTTTYYASLPFNENGGTGAPSKLYGSSAVNDTYTQRIHIHRVGCQQFWDWNNLVSWRDVYRIRNYHISRTKPHAVCRVDTKQFGLCMDIQQRMEEIHTLDIQQRME